MLLNIVQTFRYSTPAADEVPALEIGWKRGENGIEKPLDKMAASGLGKGKYVWNGIVEFTRFSFRTDQVRHIFITHKIKEPHNVKLVEALAPHT